MTTPRFVPRPPRLSLLVAAAAFSTPAFAQTSSYEFRYSSGSEWSSALPTPAKVSRTTSGDYDGDQRRDAVLLADGVPVFVYGVAYYGTMKQVPVVNGTCNDFDTAPGLATGGRDALVTVESGGMYVYVWDWAVSGFVVDRVNTQSAWHGAKLVRCADINGDQVLDFVGVKADGATVVVERSGAGGTYTQTTVSTAGSISDMLLLNFDSDSAFEIAVLDSAGVQVLDHNDTLMFTFARNAGVTSPVDAIEAVKCNGAAATRIAWARNRAAPNQAAQELVVLQRASPQVQTQYNIALQSSVFSIAGADSPYGYTQDGDTDLVLANKDLYLPLVSENNSPTSYFGTTIGYQQAYKAGIDLAATFFAPGPGDPPLALNNEAEPQYADFNKDGKPDLMLYVHDRHVLYLFESDPLTHDALLGQELVQNAGIKYDQTNDQLWLRLALYPHTIPSTIEGHDVPMGDYKYYLNLYHYVQRGPNATNATIQPVKSYSLEMFTPQQAASTRMFDPNPEVSGDEVEVVCLQVKLESSGAELCVDDVHWIEISWFAEWQTGPTPHPITQGADYFFYVSEREGDALTCWTPCYSWPIPGCKLRNEFGQQIKIDGAYSGDPDDPDVCDTNDFYFIGTCPNGSTTPVTLPSITSRRKIRFPEGNSGQVIPPPPPGNVNDAHWVDSGSEFPWF